MKKRTDKELYFELKGGDEHALEILFHKYYASLCLYALQFLEDEEKAEEFVQDMFVKIWTKREELNIETSFKQYLLRSIKNQCINYIQHLKIRQKYAQKVKDELKQESDSPSFYMEFGLAEKIENSIDSLPEKRKAIFKMSREDGLKYREIADKLGISVKTVEVQMGLALKQLREMLKDYQDYMIDLFIFYKIG
ncbi:RNA polymerase sigma-70 factor [Sunxiuqinia sp. A32]|uniref:RNA polymerase sigma-70 factor n=1 Tax=Sunxiuqinia sp. A32 TaxID=3461496 RepID=UPI0040455CEA